MTKDELNPFTDACVALVGNVAANSVLADSIAAALVSGQLHSNSGPLAISKVLKGAPGKHHLWQFLSAWQAHASHLDAESVGAMVKSALECYRLARSRSHIVDTVWTGPEVQGSEVRRTEAVVKEIIAAAESELLIVGYWLVTSTIQVQELINLLVGKARSGVKVRFVFDPGEKSSGPDNLAALTRVWPVDLQNAPRAVYSWNEDMAQAVDKQGNPYNRKLHAKVIVADRKDALVTSANLTQAGLLQNLEMGLHVKGAQAGAVVRHFNLLIDQEVLVLKV